MRIIIVDDDPIVSMSLKVIIEADKAEGDALEVVAIGNSGNDAVKLYEEHKPDVIVMDIRMEGMNGLDASEEIIKVAPDAKILLLTTFLDDEYINKALKVGVKGYVLKQDLAGLCSTIRAINDGQIVFGSRIVSKLPDIMNRKSTFDYEAHGITDREKEMIELVADGLSNKEIASKMFLSEGTVRNMMSAVLEKLNLRDRTQLACFYYQEINP
ncbi:MAG: response regulator transcription factor [Clostridia bacterium]|nr:response regulator transcription factor [Clostridia bacterium]